MSDAKTVWCRLRCPRKGSKAGGSVQHGIRYQIDISYCSAACAALLQSSALNQPSAGEPGRDVDSAIVLRSLEHLRSRPARAAGPAHLADGLAGRAGELVVQVVEVEEGRPDPLLPREQVIPEYTVYRMYSR